MGQKKKLHLLSFLFLGYYRPSDFRIKEFSASVSQKKTKSKSNKQGVKLVAKVYTGARTTRGGLQPRRPNRRRMRHEVQRSLQMVEQSLYLSLPQSKKYNPINQTQSPWVADEKLVSNTHQLGHKNFHCQIKIPISSCHRHLYLCLKTIQGLSELPQKYFDTEI